ncbi:hypothetical protein ACFSJ3_07525 [Corallincola platygyrae]|uniref:Lipoprotein n=1 Tax=Corallincola platygyrae TaxID=1193278 RepID=A0ABW4XMV9_9GAMM
MKINGLVIALLATGLSACGGGGGSGSSAGGGTAKSFTVTSLYENACGETLPNPNSQLVIHNKDGSAEQIINADADGKIIVETDLTQLTYSVVMEKVSALSGYDELQIRSFESYPAKDRTFTTYREDAGNCDCHNLGFGITITADEPILAEGTVNGSDASPVYLDDYSWLTTQSFCLNDYDEPAQVSVKARLADNSGYLFGQFDVVKGNKEDVYVHLTRKATTASEFMLSPDQYVRLHSKDRSIVYSQRNDFNFSPVYLPDEPRSDEVYYHYCDFQSYRTQDGNIIFPSRSAFSQPLTDAECSTESFQNEVVTLVGADESGIYYQSQLSFAPNTEFVQLTYEVNHPRASTISWLLYGPANNESIPLFQLTPEIDELADLITNVRANLTLEYFHGFNNFTDLAENVLTANALYAESVPKFSSEPIRTSVWVAEFIPSTPISSFSENLEKIAAKAANRPKLDSLPPAKPSEIIHTEDLTH